MLTIHIAIEGTSPLLMHRFPMDGADNPGKKRTGVPKWKEEAEASLYRDEKGQIYQPANHLECCLKEAAKSFKVSGRRGATYSKLVASTILIRPEAIPHLITDYEIDSRPVVVQRARVIRYRPIFFKWALKFQIDLHDDQLPIEVFKEILDHAGQYVGIGDYRPGKGGKFGRFMVTEFKPV